MLVKLRIRAVPELLAAALKGLVAVNRVLMRAGDYPPLYESGIRYVKEPRGRENWQTAEDLLRAKEGDCEDLASYRAAELQLRGEMATAHVIKSAPRRYHAVVLRGDGSIEDPSLHLGMKRRRR